MRLRWWTQVGEGLKNPSIGKEDCEIDMIWSGWEREAARGSADQLSTNQETEKGGQNSGLRNFEKPTPNDLLLSPASISKVFGLQNSIASAEQRSQN